MMNLLIVGCGRIGAMLASEMSQRGFDVSIVDSDPTAFEHLDADFNGLTFVGVPIDNETLVNAGIESCDALCAVTSDDNTNLMVSQLAKVQFNTPLVITRVLDPEKEDIFEEFGINSFCPTKLAIDSLITTLTKETTEEESQLVHFDNHIAKFQTMPVPKEFINMPCTYIEFENGEILYAIIDGKSGVMSLINDYSTIMHEGDTLVFSKIID